MKNINTNNMITKTEQLKPYLVTDNEEFKEIVELYNNWFAETCFLSNCNWIDTNENWKKMHEYCNEHKDILKKFWLEMYETFEEVGHFTFILGLVFPNTIEVNGHCTLGEIEKLWHSVLINNKMIEQNHEYYVSLEVAKLLKEAGFDWKCINRYIKDIEVLVPCLGEANWNAAEWGINDYKSAPTLDVAQRWLREVKGICLTIHAKLDIVNGQFNVVVGFIPFIIHRMDGEMTIVSLDSEHTYEEAQEAGIKKALEIILEK